MGEAGTTEVQVPVTVTVGKPAVEYTPFKEGKADDPLPEAAKPIVEAVAKLHLGKEDVLLVKVPKAHSMTPTQRGRLFQALQPISTHLGCKLLVSDAENEFVVITRQEADELEAQVTETTAEDPPTA